MGIDAQVEVGPIDHGQRFGDGVGVAGREVFHHHREHTLAQAGISHLRPVRGQVAGGIADHGGDALTHRCLRFSRGQWKRRRCMGDPFPVTPGSVEMLLLSVCLVFGSLVPGNGSPLRIASYIRFILSKKGKLAFLTGDRGLVLW
jgi:hypothetical protein